MTKSFKNNFGVKGPFVLLEAFKKVAEELGWTYNQRFNAFKTRDRATDSMYFNGTDSKIKRGSHEVATGEFSISDTGHTIDLTTSWNEAVKLASEMEVAVPRVKVGDWITYSNNGKKVAKVTEIINRDNSGRQCLDTNIWAGDVCVCSLASDFAKLATPKEIEDELIRQTGFAIGDTVKSKPGLNHATDFEIKQFVLITGENYRHLTYGSGCVIKKWEKTKEPFIAVTGTHTSTPADEVEKGSQLKIGRRTIEKIKLSDIVVLKVGCQDFTKNSLFLLKDICVSGVLEPGIINVYSSQDHERYTITTEILDKAIKLLDS